MKKITLWIFIFAFILIRPHELQRSGMFYPSDDYGYFADASALVYGQFPSYEKEYFLGGEKRPLTGIGPAIMASPFVFVFSLADRLMDAEIVQQRTYENILKSWSLFGFIFATQFYFCLGCFLLFKGLRGWIPERYAVLSVIFMILCQGIPIYVFHRPVSSHNYEFFLQSLCVFWLLKRFVHNPTRLPGFPFAIGLGIIIGLLVLTRYNNVAIAFVWPFVLLYSRTADLKKPDFWIRLLIVFAAAGVVVFLFMALPNLLIPSSRMSRVGSTLLKGVDPLFYLRRLGHILLGIDWGLVYSAPFLLIAWGPMVFLKFPLKRRLWICLLPMVVNLYVAIMWSTQGGYYGYRFLFPSMIPLLVYPLAVGMQEFETRFKKGAMKVWLFIALFPVLSMVCFFGNHSSLGFFSIEQYFGVMGAGNNTYQWEIWEMFLFTPVQLIIVFLQGGAFYLLYVLSSFLNSVQSLPNMINVYYPAFEGAVFLKTVMMYACPFVLYLLMHRIKPTK